MLEYARVAKPEVFIQFSTDEVYGPADVNQGHEEWATILPSNPYSASKACQEAIAISYWRSYNVPVIITNTMNNFGQYQGSSKYPVIIQKKLMAGEEVEVHVSGDGQIGTRHYIHSRNAADAVLYILKNLPPHMHEPGTIDKPDRYNVVGDAQVSNLELAKVIARLMGKELKYKLVDFHSKQPGHDVHYGLDGKKLQSLGWKSPVPFEKSLKDTIDWQIANPRWIAEK
jgi:dTDP-glucose 4,6-dehydratase